jgi:hypothetical protein
MKLKMKKGTLLRLTFSESRRPFPILTRVMNKEQFFRLLPPHPIFEARDDLRSKKGRSFLRFEQEKQNQVDQSVSFAPLFLPVERAWRKLLGVDPDVSEHQENSSCRFRDSFKHPCARAKGSKDSSSAQA